MSNAKIDIAQSALRDAWGVTGGPRADEFRLTGEIDGPMCPHRVYKTRPEQPWCFKSEIPITASSAHALAEYLAVLEAEAPNHQSEEFRRNEDDVVERALALGGFGADQRPLGGRIANASTIAGLGYDEDDLRSRALDRANTHNETAHAVVERAKTYFAFLKGD